MEKINGRIRELTDEICRLYYARVDLEQAIKSIQAQGASASFVKGIYEQLSIEADKLMERYRENAEKRQYYSINKVNHRFAVWTSRYFIAYNYESPGSDFHKIIVFDSFNDKSLEMTVDKHAQDLIDIYPLDDDFGLLLEHQDRVHFISLIFLDLHSQSVQKLTTIERRSESARITVNKADPTQFALESFNDGWSIQLFNVVKTDIIPSEIIDSLVSQPNFYEKCIYGLYWIRRDNAMIARISVYNIEHKTEEEFDLELPAGYVYNWKDVEWVRDCAITQLESVNGQVILAYGNVQTRQFTVIDFSCKSPIYDIWFVQDKDLVIRTLKSDEDSFNFYKISLRKPDRLQNMAWMILVKFMQKHKTVKNPYEAARRYLPYNSAIRCPFVKPEKDEKTGPPEKFIKLN